MSQDKLSWAPAELPPVPASMRQEFKAHSVSAAHRPGDIFAPSYDWDELQKIVRMLPATNRAADQGRDQDRDQDQDRGARATDIDERVRDGIALLPTLWQVREAQNRALVFLGCGTVALCDLEAGPRFAGFVSSEARRDPPGSIPYRIPLHRLKDGAVTGRALLFEAQRRFDTHVAAHPEDGPYASQALAVLSQAGYPNPGTPDADSNVVALWSRPRVSRGREWLALVKCGVFCHTSVTLGVLVAATAGDQISFMAMKEFADIGRECYRNDMLSPRVERVHRFTNNGI
jgi:hypothetical protein